MRTTPAYSPPNRWASGLRWLAAALLMMIIVTPPLHADVIRVSAAAAPGGDGTSWVTAFADLRSALAVAQADDQIRIGAGTYVTNQGPGPTDQTSTFAIPDGVSLFGGYAGSAAPDPNERDINTYETILTGDLAGNDDPNFGNLQDNTQHVVTIGTVNIGIRLDGLTIRGGNASDEPGGGGIYAPGTTSPLAPIRLEDCLIRSNRAPGQTGGGIFLANQTLELRRCRFVRNRAGGSGGAIAAPIELGPIEENSVDAQECTFDRNIAAQRDGGAVLVDARFCGVFRFENCTFTGNQAMDSGGAVHGDAVIEDCHFVGNVSLTADSIAYGGGALFGNYTCSRSEFRENTAVNGGAVYGGGTFVDCTFDGNWGKSAGGAWKIFASPEIAIVDCVFRGNIAEYGGAIHSGQSVNWVRIVGCAFWGNTAETSGGAIRLRAGARHLVQHCVLGGNGCEGPGSAIYNDSRLFIENSILINNESFTMGGALEGPRSARACNSVFWGNFNSAGVSQASQVHDPNHIVYHCVIDALVDDLGVGNTPADPMFIDPIGADGIAGTEDDDLHVLSGSPCIDAGWNNLVRRDVLDLDGDGDTSELTPLDLDGGPRFVDDPNTPDTGCSVPAIVDIGPYELGDAGVQPCKRDTNGNGRIDIGDLGLLLAAFGTTSDDAAWDCRVDFNADLIVNISDLGSLLAVFGQDCP